MKNFINCTPHEIKLNGGKTFPPSGEVARVSSQHTAIKDDCCEVVFGDVVGLPSPKLGTFYIVSALVANATKRDDVVCPATGHPETKRENGLIVSVPCFIKK